MGVLQRVQGQVAAELDFAITGSKRGVGVAEFVQAHRRDPPGENKHEHSDARGDGRDVVRRPGKGTTDSGDGEHRDEDRARQYGTAPHRNGHRTSNHS